MMSAREFRRGLFSTTALIGMSLVGFAAAGIPLLAQPAHATGGAGGGANGGAGGADSLTTAGGAGGNGGNPGDGGGGGGAGVTGGPGGLGGAGAAAGANGAAAGDGGGGGNGGAHGRVQNAFVPFVGASAGAGGNGGTGNTTGSGGGGGAGGYSYVMNFTGQTLNLSGAFIGGAGGAGGAGGNFGGSGGTGGIGVYAGDGNTVALLNTFSAVGGAGGAGGAGATAGATALSGNGIVGSNLTLNVDPNAVINGGINALGRANAITFTAGTNQLVFGQAANFNSLGNISVTGTLELNQNNNANSTVSNSITGSGSISKTGTGAVSLTGASSYSGTTTITAGTLGANSSSALGDGSTTNTLVFNAPNAAASTLQATGTITSPASRSVVLANAGGTGTIDTNGNTVSIAGVISGAGDLQKAGAGTLSLANSNTYSGRTFITAGTVQANSSAALGDGSTTNTLVFNAAADATSILQVTGTIASPSTRSVTLNNAGGTGIIDSNGNAVTLAGTVSGPGNLNKVGAGTLNLTGANSAAAGQFTGTANVNGGTLAVNGVFGNTATNGATVNVNNGGTLNGSGTIAGSVVVNNGGTVSAGNSPGTLNVTGNYTLNAGSTSLFELGASSIVGSGVNDLINVGRNLQLGGTLTLVNTASPANLIVSGDYRLFNYNYLGVGGTLTGNFAAINAAAGSTATIFTGIPNQVNLYVRNGDQSVQYWDGTDQTGVSGAPGVVTGQAGAQGGNGTWNTTNTNWTALPGGQVNSPWRSGVGIFGGNAGTVTVTATPTFPAFQGLQFTTSGYLITGGTIVSSGNPYAAGASDIQTANGNIPPQALSFLNVDGGVTARINSTIAGTTVPINGVTYNTGLFKLGNGTLSLEGANTYSGLTVIGAGTLAANSSAALGDASATNTLVFNAGTGTTATLQASATIDSPATRAVRLNSDGTIDTNANNVTIRGVISGPGNLKQINSGTLTLTNTNTFTGLTTNDAGTLVITNTGSVQGGVRNNQNGTFINQGTVNKRNPGTAALGLSNAGIAFNTNTINNGATNSGQLSNTGVINGGVGNGGGLNNSGTINNGLNNGGTAINTGSVGGLNNSGTYTQNGGAASTNGGTVNTGTVTANGGAFNDGITNTGSGSFTVSNDATVTANSFFTNETSASLTVGGAFTGVSTLTNTSSAALGVNVVDTGTLQTASILNSGMFSITGGRVNTAAFTNTGTLTQSAGILTPTTLNNQPGGIYSLTGGTLNASIVNNAGTITTSSQFNASTQVNNSATFNLIGGTVATPVLANTSSGTFNAMSNVAGGTAQIASTTVQNDGQFNVGGNVAGPITAFINNRVTTLSNGSVLGGVGTYTNSGTVNITRSPNDVSGLYQIQAGNFANQGLVSLDTGAVNDTLTLTGNYNGSQGARLTVDVDLTRADRLQRGDALVINGSNTGATQLDLKFIQSGGSNAFFADPIRVVQAGSGGGTVSLADPNALSRQSTGFINYFLQQTPNTPGNYEIVSRIDPSRAATSISGITGLITSLNVGFFQSINAFIGGPAEHKNCKDVLRDSKFCDQQQTTGSVGVTTTDKTWSQLNQQAAAAPVAATVNESGILPNTMGFGLWARGSGGQTTIRSTSTADFGGGATLSGQNKTRIDFAGFQVGADTAMFNIRNSGYNLHLGLTGGVVYANGKELLSSSTTAAFQVPFIGGYAALTNGPFTSDISLRHDFFDARINDPFSGINQTRLPIGSNTVGSSVGYRFDLPGLLGGEQAYFIEPSASISYTKTQIGDLGVTGGALRFSDIDSILGRLGVRAGTTFVAGDTLALQPFVTGSVWNEFAGNALSRFLPTSTVQGSTDFFVPIQTTRVGTFGQVGVGVTGQLLGTDLLGFVRGDVRFGDRLDGYSVNGGVRYAF